MRNTEAPTDEPDDDRPSKSRLKREMHARQELGRRLTGLGNDLLRRLPLEESLREAVFTFQSTKTHEARRRQLQYIGKLMRDADCDAIAAALDLLTGQSQASVALMHECERLRNALIADDAALTEFLKRHTGVDAQWLRAKLRSARQELSLGKPPQHSREIYRWLHEFLRLEHQSGAATTVDSPAP